MACLIIHTTWVNTWLSTHYVNLIIALVDIYLQKCAICFNFQTIPFISVHPGNFDISDRFIELLGVVRTKVTVCLKKVSHKSSTVLQNRYNRSNFVTGYACKLSTGCSKLSKRKFYGILVEYLLHTIKKLLMSENPIFQYSTHTKLKKTTRVASTANRWTSTECVDVTNFRLKGAGRLPSSISDILHPLINIWLIMGGVETKRRSQTGMFWQLRDEKKRRRTLQSRLKKLCNATVQNKRPCRAKNSSKSTRSILRNAPDDI